jgi:hypothetical protein
MCNTGELEDGEEEPIVAAPIRMPDMDAFDRPPHIQKSPLVVDDFQ